MKSAAKNGLSSTLRDGAPNANSGQFYTDRALVSGVASILGCEGPQRRESAAHISLIVSQPWNPWFYRTRHLKRQDVPKSCFSDNVAAVGGRVF
jgi:hypothetical protein